MDKLVTISLLEEKLQQNDFASARVLYDSLPDSIEKADAAYKLIEAYCSAVVSENLDGVSQTQANHRILAIEVYNSMAESSTELILKKADAACYMVEGCISYHALYVKDTVIGDDFVCNHIAPACAIYDSMPEDSTATKVFAACQLITAYCMAGDLASARALYDSIVDIQIDDMSSLIARRAYYSEKPRTTADLLCAYYYAGDLASANELYSSMPDSPEKSKIAYHVIGNFTDSDNFDFARELFDSMPISGTTDESTELIAETKRDTAWLLMSSYCIAGNIAAACAMYDSMPYSDEFAEIKGETAHLLIGQYADTSMIESARALYDSMPEDSASLILAKANATSALISAYGDIGALGTAAEIYASIPYDNAELIERKTVSARNLISAYCNADMLAAAHATYDGIPYGDSYLALTWKADATCELIDCYCDIDNLAIAHALYDDMPDSDYGRAGKKANAAIKLVNCYCKTGDLASANVLYASMPESSAELIARKAEVAKLIAESTF